MAYNLTAEDVRDYVLRVKGLDDFAVFLAHSELRTNIQVWHHFVLIAGAHYLAHVGPAMLEDGIVSKAGTQMRVHYLQRIQ